MNARPYSGRRNDVEGLVTRTYVQSVKYSMYSQIVKEILLEFILLFYILFLIIKAKAELAECRKPISCDLASSSTLLHAEDQHKLSYIHLLQLKIN
ncbi:MAG: hypothetical protein CYG59_10365 [Chloroflexi bacterium]|nr:MAG: hypothetical protein CYG59_10365 [Chloroflexota bacterium]